MINKKYKTKYVKHPALGVMSVEKYLSTANEMRKMGNLDHALVMYHVLEKMAIDDGDRELRELTRKQINKHEFKLEVVTYDMSLDAAAPVNRDPGNPGSEEAPKTVSRPVGNKTFKFSINNEEKHMINSRLEQARLVLVHGGYMTAEKAQWKDLFSGHTTYDKIKWTGEKGHIVYFIQAIKDYIQNNTGFGIWEVVAAHFKWYFTYQNGKIADEDFDHKKLSYGKATQAKELDNAAEWFKPQKNPNYGAEEREEENPYTYNEELTNSELKSDAWNNGLRVPHGGVSYSHDGGDINASEFHLSDDL